MSLKPSTAMEKRKKLSYGLAASVIVFLIALGVFASNGWLPKTDTMTGKKTGWFGYPSSPPYEGGVDASRGRGGSLSEPPAPLPNATPSLSKEYIYAGSRLLAVEDANASAIPPVDIAVWRPTTGAWLVMGSSGSQAVNTTWGQNGDQPIPADFDGDGKTDLSIYRRIDGTWWIQKSSGGAAIIIAFGAPCQVLGKKCEQAVPADFDGDGKSDYVVFEPSERMWAISLFRLISTATERQIIAFGKPRPDGSTQETVPTSIISAPFISVKPAIRPFQPTTMATARPTTRFGVHQRETGTSAKAATTKFSRLSTTDRAAISLSKTITTATANATKPFSVSKQAATPSGISCNPATTPPTAPPAGASPATSPSRRFIGGNFGGIKFGGCRET